MLGNKGNASIIRIKIISVSGGNVCVHNISSHDQQIPVAFRCCIEALEESTKEGELLVHPMAGQTLCVL